MTSINYAEKFWKDGFIVLENFFDPDKMDQYNKTIVEHYGMMPDWEHTDEFIEKSATEVVPWFPAREGNMMFDTLENDPVLRNLTDSILGEGWENLYSMAMFSKRGTKGQAWHQDCPPENPRTFNLNRLIYTHDITDETGGFTVVTPGSHKKGALSVGDPHEDLDGQIVLKPKKGTLVLLHGHCWHRVLPVTGAYRVSVNFRAVPEGTPEDITDIAVYRNMRYRFSTNSVIEEYH